MIDVICATRFSEEDFWAKSPLGISLQQLEDDQRLLVGVAFENEQALPKIYNENIADRDASEIIVFIHDDVWISDLLFADRIIEGLNSFDVLGVVGNRRRRPYQPSWVLVDDNFTWDDSANLSGAIACGQLPFPLSPVGLYGPTPAECELLDGLFLAAKTATLREKNVVFDPTFDFHFYDMDFCRTSRQQGLRLGTWPIYLTHQSRGGYGSEGWRRNYQAYINKWGS